MVLHGSPEQLGFSRTGLPISQTQWLLFRQPFPLAMDSRADMRNVTTILPSEGSSVG